MHTEAVENYLTEILRLEPGRGAVSTSALADRLGVARPSVTAMLQRLADGDLVNYEPYRGASLTRRGRHTARAMLRRHRLIETFLVRAFGLTHDQVHEEAHRWEHVLSDDVVERLDRWLGHPEVDPHGSPIPGPGRRDATRRLASLAPGQTAVVDSLHARDHEHATYLESLGLVPGAVVTFTAQQPYAGPVTLTVDDRSVIVGPEVTEHVSVHKE